MSLRVRFSRDRRRRHETRRDGPRPPTRGFAASQPAAWLRWSGAACAASVICQIVVCRRFFKFGVSAFFNPSATNSSRCPGRGRPRGYPNEFSAALRGPGTGIVGRTAHRSASEAGRAAPPPRPPISPGLVRVVLLLLQCHASALLRTKNA